MTYSIYSSHLGNCVNPGFPEFVSLWLFDKIRFLTQEEHTAHDDVAFFRLLVLLSNAVRMMGCFVTHSVASGFVAVLSCPGNKQLQGKDAR
jgi:hypothetical protein